MIASCDPGLNGALTFLVDPKTIAALYDLPFVKWYSNYLLDVDAVRAILDAHKPRVVVIEKVGVTKNDGKTQAANFMRNFGALIGAAASYERVFIPPTSWKPSSGLFKKPKIASYHKACEIFGSEWFDGHTNKIDRAESALIGRHYLRIKEKVK